MPPMQPAPAIPPFEPPPLPLSLSDSGRRILWIVGLYRAVCAAFLLGTALLIDPKLLNVATPNYPIAAQRGQTFAHIADGLGISPNSAGVIDTDGRVFFEIAVKVLRGRQRDLAKRDA